MLTALLLYKERRKVRRQPMNAIEVGHRRQQLVPCSRSFSEQSNDVVAAHSRRHPCKEKSCSQLTPSSSSSPPASACFCRASISLALLLYSAHLPTLHGHGRTLSSNALRLDACEWGWLWALCLLQQPNLGRQPNLQPIQSCT